MQPNRSSSPSPPLSSPSPSSGRTSVSSLEMVEGRVESVTQTGVRIDGRWYEFQSGWSGRRPATGEQVQVRYRTKRLVEMLTVTSSQQRPTPSNGGAMPSSTASRGAPTSLSSNAKPSSAAASRERETIRGRVEALNERGLRVGQTWYNFSRYTPVPEDRKAKLVKGCEVRLLVENGRWIVELDVLATENGAEASADWEHAEEEADESYL